jgi:hypothetical protein
VREILSERLCVSAFCPLLVIKPTWPDGLQWPPVTQSGHCDTAARSSVLV